ncbi:MAG: UDP-N-acetylmuramoyl-L-alanyl-D-glutamate--2,6-diaminopimelate ligase [Bacillota bacterium]
MQLSKLCEGAEVIKFIGVNKEKEITNLTIDYKDAESDSVFFAIKGDKFNGNVFSSEVVKKGGVVVTDDENYAHNFLISGGKNLILAKSARGAMSQISANFYENPQEKLKIIAVVGTNGKTSTACILRDIFEYSGIRTGIIGTLETRFEDLIFQSEMTTPDPIKLFEILSEMQKAGCKVVVMEWSAHAIALEKLSNLTCEIAIFTNLSQDHLDFFGDMKEYKEAKKSIFVKERVKMAVVNADDACGAEIISESRIPILSYGIENVCDVFCIFGEDMQKFTNKIFENEKNNATSGELIVNYLDEICTITSFLKGRFNVYNLLGSVAAARYFGIDFKTIASAVLGIEGVAGRYQTVENDLGIEIVIDYAHTPDGMENILKEMKNSLSKTQTQTKTQTQIGEKPKLICVFGCGGNRDKTKRNVMGGISEKYADVTILTSDNPRLENPESITNDILHGFQNSENAIVIQKRESAINHAINIAKKGDSIAILGKGHEDYIDEAGEKRYYTDIETVKKYI